MAHRAAGSGLDLGVVRGGGGHRQAGAGRARAVLHTQTKPQRLTHIRVHIGKAQVNQQYSKQAKAQLGQHFANVGKGSMFDCQLVQSPERIKVHCQGLSKSWAQNDFLSAACIMQP